MFNTIITILLLSVLLGTILIMLKYKKVFLAKNSIFILPMMAIMVSIYYVGMEYENTAQRIFTSFSYSINALAFRDNFHALREVYRSDMHFVINYYVNLFMLGFMSFSAIIDLFFKQIVNFFKLKFKSSNSIVLITEPNDSDSTILIKGKERRICILTKPNQDFEKMLMDNNVAFVVGLTIKNFKKFAKNGNKFISLLKNPDDILLLIDFFKDLKSDCYIEADDSIEALIEDKLDNRFNIFLFNKYKLIGYDFLLNNCIAKNLDSTYIDRETSLLKNDKDINIFMIGFDLANKNIYLELVRNNQFSKLIDNKLTAYKVNYHIYADVLRDTILLNHKLRDAEFNPDEYYAPFEPTFSFDIKCIDYSLYDSIKSQAKRNAMNIFIISQDNTYRGLDYARRIDSMLSEYDHAIYLRDYLGEIKSPGNIITFGDEKNIITTNNIINEDLFELAKKRAALYDSSSNADEVWRKLPRDKRLSNINCIISINHKLALMGLKISKNGYNNITEEEYFNIYDNGHEIELKDGRVNYPLYFTKRLNNRNSLAFIEHSRWNVEMLVKGYLPMKIKDLHYDYDNKRLAKDDQVLKLHSCITSFDGLDKYYDKAAKILAEALNISYEEAYSRVENKKYDYELMDNAYSLINQIGSGIERI